MDHNVLKCDGIFHVGAIADTTLQDPNEMLIYNYTYSKKIFDLAKKYNKKVVYSSSAAVYGTDGVPTNIYGWSKLLAEQYGDRTCRDRFVALRYFNVYGPGEEHKGKMASIAYQAWKKGDFKLFPGEPKRDFVYIKDVVDATIYPLFNHVKSGIYEVGSGEARTFEDVLNLMGVKYRYRNEVDVPNGYQYFTKANKNEFMDGWSPIYNLEKGLKEYRDYLES